ncbi:MAG: ribonuclease P protein component [Candidatus Nomurabacteria bacterium]|nr:ribonuclease P protein component [Candidatus Nomurabacteria bacterium]
MISKKYRFHGHNSLRYVFSNGQVAHSKFFTVKWVNNDHRHHPRVSVVVSKKIFKSAVKRNHVRRRIYEITRPLLSSTPAIDTVINIHSTDVLAATHDELAIQLLPLLHEAGFKVQAVH